MARVYDFAGQFCGNAEEGASAPPGYWLRSEDSPELISSLEFLDKIGPVRFAAVWQASLANSTIAFSMMRGLAAQQVHISESFPVLVMMEQAGLLPAGTALEVWA